MYNRRWGGGGFLEEVTFMPKAERREIEKLKENLTSFFNSNKPEILSDLYF